MEKYRKIVKMGGSIYIKLFPVDLKDCKVKIGDEVDVSDMINKIKRKEKPN